MRKVSVIAAVILMTGSAQATDPAAPMTRAEAVAMSHEELASRTFAQLAGIFWKSRVDYLVPSSTPPFLGRATFYTKPQVAVPGICSLYEVSVSYRPDKPIPPGQPIGDPPSRASFVQTGLLYAIVGPIGDNETMTEESIAATQAACEKITLRQNFIYATDDVWRAAHFLEVVTRQAGSVKTLPFTLSCNGDKCGDMRSYLAKMTVQAIESVASCRDPLDSYYGPPYCFIVTVNEPSGKPESWRLKISGQNTPTEVIMKPEMRPVL